VTPGGSRLWQLAYRFKGKQRVLARGKYPDVSPGDAQLARRLARKHLDDGIEPSETRKSDKRLGTIVASHTFRSVADAWFESQKGRGSRAIRIAAFAVA
jgi:hypothetical protein